MPVVGRSNFYGDLPFFHSFRFIAENPVQSSPVPRRCLASPASLPSRRLPAIIRPVRPIESQVVTVHLSLSSSRYPVACACMRGCSVLLADDASSRRFSASRSDLHHASIPTPIPRPCSRSREGVGDQRLMPPRPNCSCTGASEPNPCLFFSPASLCRHARVAKWRLLISACTGAGRVRAIVPRKVACEQGLAGWKASTHRKSVPCATLR